MNITRQVLVYDTADLEAESSFWARMLGGTVQRDDDWHSLSVDGQYRMAFQLAPNHLQPDWPDGQPQQAHIDLYVDDIAAADAEALAHGARPLTAPDLGSDEGFRVYASPSGHPFCLCWDAR